ncbi:MAG: hypothetical protein M5U28_51575 [Sandaracinaceae bacterium]|nr:hypothetical protein [Sandaracinaceae bacterium]
MAWQDAGRMRVAVCAVLGSLLCACGAAAPAAVEPGAEACRAACERAGEAWSAVAARAEEAARPAPDEEPLAAEQALDRLEEHASALTREPREVEGDEAFALSSAMMDAIDAAGAELPAAPRARRSRRRGAPHRSWPGRRGARRPRRRGGARAGARRHATGLARGASDAPGPGGPRPARPRRG